MCPDVSVDQSFVLLLHSIATVDHRSETETDQRLKPSSAPLVGNNNSNIDVSDSKRVGYRIDSHNKAMIVSHVGCDLFLRC